MTLGTGGLSSKSGMKRKVRKKRKTFFLTCNAY
jgi:hypothetical protein